MEEERSTRSGDVDQNLEIGSSESNADGNDFCLLSEDDIEMEDSEEGLSLQSPHSIESSRETSKDDFQSTAVGFVDVETMKRKAEVKH